MGGLAIFVPGADRIPPRPRPTDPLYNRTRTTLRYDVVCYALPGNLLGAPPSRQPPTGPAAGLNRACLPSSPRPGPTTTGGTPSGRSSRAPPCSSLSLQRAGTQSRCFGPPQPTCTRRRKERRQCPAPPLQWPRPGMRYTRLCGAGRLPPSVESTWCGSPRRAPTNPLGPGQEAPSEAWGCSAVIGPSGSYACCPSTGGWPSVRHPDGRCQCPPLGPLAPHGTTQALHRRTRGEEGP